MSLKPATVSPARLSISLRSFLRGDRRVADYDERRSSPLGLLGLAMDAAVDERQHGPAPVVVLEEIATAFGMPLSPLLDELAAKSELD